MTTLENIDYYQDGEDVTPEVLNRPLTNLENNQNAINTDVGAIGDGVLPADFFGSWSKAAGFYSAGSRFSHQGKFWELVANTQEVSAVEPSLNSPSVWINFGDIDAINTRYDNSTTGLSAITVQDAIDEVFKFEAPCKPTLDLDFANQDFTIYSPIEGFVKKPLADIMDITRASNGTSVNALGGITTLGVDQPRYEFDGETGAAKGILVEGSATNLIRWSEDFSKGAWFSVRTIVTSNSIKAPDGTMTADKFIANTEVGEHYIDQAITPAAGTYTFSVYAKAGEIDTFRLRPIHTGSDQGNSITVQFTLTGSGSHTVPPSYATATIEPVGDGWYFCSVTVTLTGNVTALRHRIQTLDNLAGDGTSGIYIWGAQLTVTPYPVSYIKTEASTVTRSADSVTRTLGEEFNSNEFTMLVEFEMGADYAQPSATATALMALTDGTWNNGLGLLKFSGSSSIFLLSRIDGSTDLTATAVLGVNVYSRVNRIAVSKDSNGVVRYSVNGTPNNFEGVTASDSNLINTLTVGGVVATTRGIFTIRDQQLYPRTFDSLTLQRLSRIK